MTGTLSIAVTGELWGAFLCFMSYLVMAMYRGKSKRDTCVRRMLFVCVILLVSDAISWAFNGAPGDSTKWVLYVANYVQYASSYLIIACFIWYAWQMARREGEQVPLLFRVFFIADGLSLVALTIGVFFNLYFYIDDANVYHRTDAFLISQVITVFGVAALIWSTVRFRSRLSKFETIASCSYFVLPPLGTIIQAIAYGLPFQQYAFAVATLITFFVREADVRGELVETTNRELANKAALEKAVAEADAASNAKTSFLFSMSHDIRTPMNAIIGYANLIDKHYGDEETCREYIKKVQSSSEFLLSLINNVLELARIESGKMELDEVICDTRCVQGAIENVFDEMMEKKHIEFVKSKDVHTPYVWGDRVKLNEVFLNLVSNAYKYTPEGGKIEMYLKELPHEKPGWIYLQTTLKDNGIGMSADYLPTLFEEFTREHTVTENKIQGTGLGMPIVKKLVDLMDGTITVESELGKGTTFVVTIPNRIVDEEPELKETVEETAEVDLDKLVGKRILLAEDNDLNAEIAEEILGEAGFEVERAEDGIICVDMLQKAEPGYYDVILMDIQMPNMDGYKATKTIRALQESEKSCIPIVAMTANAFEEDKKNAFAAGMNGHLGKPINVKELMATLASVLAD